MIKKNILIIIAFSVVALLAALFTQVLWISDVLELKQQQFDNKVKIALKTVVNRITFNEETVDTMPVCNVACIHQEKELVNLLKTKKFATLLKTEFLTLQLPEDYVFAVINMENRKLIFGEEDRFKDELLASRHIVSLSCMREPEEYALSVYFPDEKSSILSQMIVLPVMSGLFFMFLIAGFFFTVYSLLRQKKLSEMKSDFVNNMTHELKTPISTIAVTSELLMASMMQQDKDKCTTYARIISEENLHLRDLVDQVLRSAMLDKNDFHIEKNPVDVHEVIGLCLRNFSCIVEDCHGMLKQDLSAKNTVIEGDGNSLRNVFNNILDNAVKYSEEAPEITITTRNEDETIVIAIEDKGMGISREDQKHIFKKFHRAHTGNIHNVKGYGIGLYYVAKITEAHGGRILLKSELKHGTRFEIILPLIRS